MKTARSIASFCGHDLFWYCDSTGHSQWFFSHLEWVGWFQPTESAGFPWNLWVVDLPLLGLAISLPPSYPFLFFHRKYFFSLFPSTSADMTRKWDSISKFSFQIPDQIIGMYSFHLIVICLFLPFFVHMCDHIYTCTNSCVRMKKRNGRTSLLGI